MTEFKLIQQYFSKLGVIHPETIIGIGDDAAVIEVPKNHQLVISTDSMLENIHFPADTIAKSIAIKLAAVNLSDMAAMGAMPKWATLSLSISNYDEDWLQGFSSGLSQMLEHYHVELIGGDTTQGELSLTLQMMGLVEKNKSILRSGAQIGDNVYVSGYLGDAALGLQYALNKPFDYLLDTEYLINALQHPTPRVALGQKLNGIASSCIDVSDGLLSELGHISKASGVGIDIQLEQIPLSEQYQNYLQQGGDYQYAVAGGDDYELCFTAPAELHQQIMQIADKDNIMISKIGYATATEKLSLFLHGKPYSVINTKQSESGYQHFK